MPTRKPIVLITGASGGIGKSLCEEFAKDGYDLILTARNVAKMQVQAAELLQRHGARVTVIGADLESAAGAQQLHAEIKQSGVILNALVNNAGYSPNCFYRTCWPPKASYSILPPRRHFSLAPSWRFTTPPKALCCTFPKVWPASWRVQELASRPCVRGRRPRGFRTRPPCSRRRWSKTKSCRMQPRLQRLVMPP